MALQVYFAAPLGSGCIQIQPGDILGVYSNQASSALAYIYDSLPSAIQSMGNLFPALPNANEATIRQTYFTAPVNFTYYVFPYEFALAALYFYGSYASPTSLDSTLSQIFEHNQIKQSNYYYPRNLY